MDHDPGLPRAARVYMLATVLAGALCVLVQLFTSPGVPSLGTWLLAGAGGLLGSRVIRVGTRLNMAVLHPFIFAAMVLDGGRGALLVAVASTLCATLLKQRRMRPEQVLFNVATVLLSAALASAVHGALLPVGARGSIERSTLPVLAASLAFFVLNSGLVAIIVGLERRSSIARAWQAQLWSLPSFVAGGMLGLGVAICLLGPWRMLVPVALPFAYLIHASYRLYSERLREREARIEMVEKLNRELEQRVRERTEELLRLNEDLALSNRRLEEASRHKSEFLARISHELRTPLNAIIGFSELLASESAGTVELRQREYLLDIHSAGTDLLAIINDLLDLSKIEAGKMRIDFERCRPDELARQVVAMVRLLAAAKSLRLSLEIDGEIPEIEADALRVKQVLRNLLSNAIRFTPEGGRVEVSVAAAEEGVRFRVVDDGAGIPEVELDRIFEDFHQVEEARPRSPGGTGLGLALVRSFTEMHGGRVRVWSTLGQGSTFEVWIPRAQAREETMAALQPAAVAS